jgi:ABC-type bacteriocin/lantibiotic exporter with double-glycine peptidase domain
MPKETGRAKMRHVRQVHMTGCGVATFAMLAGMGYQRALKAVHPKRKKGASTCTHPMQTFQALEKLGLSFKVSFTKFKLRNLEHNTELSYRIPYGAWHAVVWDVKRQRILDPGHKDGKSKVSNEYIEKHTRYRVEIL